MPHSTTHGGQGRAFAPRRIGALSLAVGCAGCAAGSATLGYRVPDVRAVTYAYGDTTLVGLSLMGQQLEIAMRGEADYGIEFGPAPAGVEVRLTVERLAAVVAVPMAGEETVDESAVQGPLVFTLGPTGDAAVVSTPEVSIAAARMISSLTTAHSFFPGLPDRAVVAGDRWVDTVAYEGDAELGATSEETVVTYTVVGDTVVAGRSLLHIGLTGTSRSSNQTTIGGMQVAQATELALEGHVLWDRDRGLMYEIVRRGTGSGTVRVPIAPQPLPVQVSVTQRASLQPQS